MSTLTCNFRASVTQNNHIKIMISTWNMGKMNLKRLFIVSLMNGHTKAEAHHGLIWMINHPLLSFLFPFPLLLMISQLSLPQPNQVMKLPHLSYILFHWHLYPWKSNILYHVSLISCMLWIWFCRWLSWDFNNVVWIKGQKWIYWRGPSLSLFLFYISCWSGFVVCLHGGIQCLVMCFLYCFQSFFCYVYSAKTSFQTLPSKWFCLVCLSGLSITISLLRTHDTYVFVLIHPFLSASGEYIIGCFFLCHSLLNSQNHNCTG